MAFLLPQSQVTHCRGQEMRPILRFSEKKIYWKCQKQNAVYANVSLQYGKKSSVKQIMKIENSNSPDSAQRISVSEAGK